MYTTESDPQGKLQALDDYVNRRYILCKKKKKSTIPVMPIMGEAMHVGRQGVLGNLCIFVSILLQM